MRLVGGRERALDDGGDRILGGGDRDTGFGVSFGVCALLGSIYIETGMSGSGLRAGILIW